MRKIYRSLLIGSLVILIGSLVIKVNLASTQIRPLPPDPRAMPTPATVDFGTGNGCVRVLLDNVLPLQVSVKFTYNTVSPPGFHETMYYGIYGSLQGFFGLPTNVPIRMTTDDLEGQWFGPSQQLITYIRIPDPPGTVSRTAPYPDCYTTSVRIPIDSPHALKFLNQPSSTTSDPAYYSATEPKTLKDFWTLAGFTAAGGGGYTAAYMNNNTLGLGLDVHMIEKSRTPETVYSYMTLYGKPDQNPLNADYAAAKNVAQAGYTLAMGYVEGATPPVKYWIYDGSAAAAKLTNSVDLDGLGKRYVPNLCKNCHGDENDVFALFDTNSMLFAKGATKPTAAQSRQFYLMNTLATKAHANQLVLDVYKLWYPGAPLPGPSYPPPNSTNVPTLPAGNGWADGIHPDLYRNVYAKYSRACHIPLTNRDFGHYNLVGSSGGFKDWIQSSGYVVCATVGSTAYKAMPHSLIAYRNFWLSTAPADLVTGIGADWPTGRVDTPCR